jgi:uncharacterized protein (DUF952 family)
MIDLYHITTIERVSVTKSIGKYTPIEFPRDGFVHCSFRHQVASVANRFYSGKQGLVLLKINPSAVEVPIVEENLEGGTELFPHIYGPIPWDAIVEQLTFRPDSDGVFREPFGNG